MSFCRRVRELGDECHFLRGSLDKFVQRQFQHTKEAEEREALLAPRAGVIEQLRPMSCSIYY
jgi:hypothetical protein